MLMRLLCEINKLMLITKYVLPVIVRLESYVNLMLCHNETSSAPDFQFNNSKGE